ncbi:MAG: Bacterial transferase hexapeptide (Six repeats) (modular protein) [Promethearchaeota archaeon]|nr:MAG: Bacterial transferase hexapeptide (Six repeats) (modular protein) [Candidatus Lokiarchaeota archaeon]
MVLGAQPPIFWIWFYWSYIGGFSVLFFLLFPIALLGAIFLLIISSAVISRFFLAIANIIHPPREGVFPRSTKDKDYCYWSLRAVIKKWPIWIARQLSIHYIETILLRIYGVKVGKMVSLHEGWVDTELIELGNDVRLGQGSLILSSFLANNKLILKKTVIEDGVIIGAHSVVFPGTKIEHNTILDSLSTTTVGQTLENEAVYRDSPCKKVFKNPHIKNENVFQEMVFRQHDKERYEEEDLREEAKELAVPFHLYISSGWAIIGFSYIIPGFLFYLYLFGLLEPYLFSIPITIISFTSLKNWIMIITLPVILICLYLLHLVFVAIFTRFFYSFADKRGPAQGIFDRNLNEESNVLDYYHFRSFLFKYPIFAFIRSPFPWLINWELRFLGSNKIGKGTVIEEAYLHSHIHLGKECYLGTFTHLTNHLVDGVYGEENLTFFGAEVEDNSIFEALTGTLPGTKVGKNSTFIPIGSTVKFDELKGDGIYFGFPAKKLTKEEKGRYLGDEFADE